MARLRRSNRKTQIDLSVQDDRSGLISDKTTPQGTVWPWLMGRVHYGVPSANRVEKAAARLEQFGEHLGVAWLDQGLGNLRWRCTTHFSRLRRTGVERSRTNARGGRRAKRKISLASARLAFYP